MSNQTVISSFFLVQHLWTSKSAEIILVWLILEDQKVQFCQDRPQLWQQNDKYVLFEIVWVYKPWVEAELSNLPPVS